MIITSINKDDCYCYNLGYADPVYSKKAVSITAHTDADGRSAYLVNFKDGTYSICYRPDEIHFDKEDSVPKDKD